MLIAIRSYFSKFENIDCCKFNGNMPSCLQAILMQVATRAARLWVMRRIRCVTRPLRSACMAVLKALLERNVISSAVQTALTVQ